MVEQRFQTSSNKGIVMLCTRINILGSAGKMGENTLKKNMKATKLSEHLPYQDGKSGTLS